MDWKAEDKLKAWQMFEDQMTMYFEIANIEKEKEWIYIEMLAG